MKSPQDIEPSTPDRSTIALSPSEGDEPNTLREAWRQLDNERRCISRLIGEHKKAGRPFDHLLAETKVLSQKLRALEQSLADLDGLRNPPPPQATVYTAQDAPSAPLSHQPPEPNAPNVAPGPYTVVRIGEDGAWAEKWNAFVDRREEASVYHRYEFKTIIENAFGQRCIYLAAIDDNGDVIGVLPAAQLNSRLFGNYIVSLPYFNYGGVLSDVHHVSTRLIEYLVEEARSCGARHIEMRDTAPRPLLPVKTEKVTMLRDLPASPEQLWRDIGSKVRAQIKVAQGHDLRIVFGKAELLDDFYTVFAQNMRDLGTPIYAKRIFKSLLSYPALATTIAIVYQGRKPVSCAFLLGYRQRLEIPWASTRRNANKLNANMFMYWQILSFAIEQGYTCFDFGRSSKEAGTYKFKKQWGAKPHQLYWHYWLASGEQLPQMNPNNPKYRLLIAIWRRLPVFVTRLLGPPIVKNLP